MTWGLGWCWLKGAQGDALNAVLAAAGYNLRWLLRAIADGRVKPVFFAPVPGMAGMAGGAYRQPVRHGPIVIAPRVGLLSVLQDRRTPTLDAYESLLTSTHLQFSDFEIMAPERPRMKKIIRKALPLPLLKVIRAMRTTLTHTRWRLTFLAARLAGGHGVASFSPGFPSSNAALYTICAVNGWSMRRSRKAGLSFFWPLDESVAPAILPDLTNGRCININKSNVAKHFEQAFGFTYVVDPLTHSGPYVRESDENAKHDGVVMNAPSDPIPGMFYQILIDNSISDNEIEDIRLVYVRGIIDFSLQES